VHFTRYPSADGRARNESRPRRWHWFLVAAALLAGGAAGAAAPANDSHQTPLPLSEATGVLDVDLREATLDPEEPGSGKDLRRSLWFEWTAPAAGTLLISVADSPNLTPHAAAFRLSPAGEFGPAQPVDFRLEGSVPVTAGDRWRLVVGDQWGPDEPVILRHRFVPVPVNDLWTAAMPVPNDESEVIGTLWGATLDSREGDAAGALARVWYTWKAPADGWATVELRSLNPLDSAFLPAVFRGRPEFLGRTPVPIESLTSIPVGAGDELSILPGGAPNVYALRVLLTTARLIVEPSDPQGHEAGRPAVARIIVSEADGDAREAEFVINGRTAFTDAAPPYEWDLAALPSGVYALAGRVIRRNGEVRAIPPQPLEIRPDNDRFAAAGILEGESAVAEARLAGATEEVGEPGHVGFPASRTVWWRWTAPRDGGARLSLTRPGSAWPDALLAVYRGEALHALQVVGGTETGTLILPVRSGETYRIVAGCGPVCDDGLRELAVEMFPAAANDDFADATGLSGDALTVQAYAGIATREPEEWVVPPESPRSLWWHWTAPAAGILEVLAGPATYLDAYTGDSLATLAPLANLPSNHGRFALAAGSRVFLRARPSGLAVEVEFTLGFTPLPPNDAFANATPVGTLPARVRGELGLATGESGEPNPAVFGPPRSLWYRWAADTTGPVFLATEPPSDGENAPPGWGRMPTVVVYTGAQVGQLTPVAVPGQVFDASKGTDYWIGVFAGSSEEVPIPFGFSLLAHPVNDRIAHAPILPESGGRIEGYTAQASTEGGDSMFPPSVNGTVWFRWNPAATGAATLVCRGSADARVWVFSGETPRPEGAVDLDRVLEMTGFSAIHVPVEGGRPLWIAVGTSDIHARDGGWFELTVAPSDIEVVGSAEEIIEGTPVEFEVGSRLATGLSLSLWDPPAVTDGLPLEPDLGRFRFDSLSPGHYRVVGAGTNAAGFLLVGRSRSLRVAPTNDTFAGAVRVQQWPLVLSGSTVGASREPDEPVLEDQGEGGSRWWTWRAPADGALRLSEIRGVGLFEGGSVGGLTPVLLEPGESSSFMAQVRSGGLYHLMAVPSLRWPPGAEAGSDPYFSARVAWIPANDRFENRIAVTGDTLELTADHAGAGSEPDESPVTDWLPASVWYSWTAPGDGWMTLEETTSRFLRSARVYRLGDGDRLRLMASTRSGLVPFRMPVSAGASYEMAFCDASAPLEGPEAIWRLRWYPTATNDAFAGRTLLEGDAATLQGFTLGTTWEAGEEERRHEWTGELIERSQWFSWTAPASGWARLEQELGPPAVFLEVFEGDSLGSLQSLWPPWQSFQPVPGLDFLVEEGRAYAIWVGAGRDHPGPFRVRLLGPHPPANDSFASAEFLEGTAPWLLGTTRNATLEPEESDATPFPATESVWYRWTSPGRGLLQYWGSQWGISLWLGDSLAGLRALGSSDFFGSRVEAGREYFIRVTGTDRGLFAIPLTFQPSPANDDFAQAAGLVLSPAAWVEGPSLGATAEEGESAPSVWWRWTAPESGRLAISREGQVLDFGRAVSASQMSWVLPISWVSEETVHPVRAGTEYFFRVTRWDSGPVRFRVEFAPEFSAASVHPPEISGSRLRLPLSGTSGQIFSVEESTDLKQWTPAARQWLLFPGEDLWLPLPDGPIRYFRPGR